MTMRLIKYSPHYIMSFKYRNRNMEIPEQVSSLLLSLDIFKYFNPRRGKSSGRRNRILSTERNVKVVISIKRPRKDSAIKTKLSGANLSNLVKVRSVPSFYALPKILCTNLRSIANKYEQTQLVMRLYKPDIAIFSETWITSDMINAFEIHNYVSHHCIRSRADKHHGGGVSVYINNSFTVLQNKVCTIDGLEVVTVMCRPSVIPRNLPWFAFIAAYFPPNDTNGFAMTNYIIAEVDRLYSINCNAAIFILGDLNNLDLSSILRLTKFSQILRAPNRKDNILSKCITNVTYKMDSSVLPPIATSDHNLIIISPQHYIPLPRTSRVVTYRENKPSNRISMATALRDIDWSYLDQFTSVQLMADQFYDHLTILSDIIFPYVEKIKKDFGHPWINDQIMDLFKQRQSLRQLQGPECDLFILQNKLKRCINLAKKDYSNSLQDHMYKSPTQFYKLINQLIDPNFNSRLSSDQGLVFKDLDINETNVSIANHFGNILSKHSSIVLSDVHSIPHSSNISCADTTWVASQLKSIKNGSSAPCEIPNFIYRYFYLFLAQPITKLINLSTSQNRVPTQWKNSYLVPIPKVHAPKDPSQLRPICISSPIGKICERHIMYQLFQNISPSIDQFQFGGIPKRSTVQYLAIYLHSVLQQLENRGTKVTSIFTDFDKAFDNVDHKIMLNKLSAINTPQCLINWIASFLHERRIILRNGNSPHLTHIVANSNGLPQGSVLGSFLFAIFTNDFASSLPHRLKYVDDISVMVNSLATDVQNLPQCAFDQLVTQSNALDLPLNVSKCKTMTHCFAKSYSMASISSNNILVQEVKSIKLLGITIQNDLKWDIHICNIVKSANRRLFMLYALRRTHASTSCMLRCYFTYVRPLLEYCSPIWGSSMTDKQSNIVEGVQRRVCRIILMSKHVSYEGDLLQLNIPSLKHRRLEAAKKFALSFAAEFPGLLPDTRGSVSGRSTRQADKLYIPYAKTNRFKLSPLMVMFKNLNDV